MEKRMKQLERCSRRWRSGYLLIENGHCLIEDEEGEIMLPESLQSTMICLKENDTWTKGELLGSMILHESGQLVEVQGGEVIQYTASLAKGWLDLLMFVPENVFYEIIAQVEQLGFSVYDCVFSSFYSFQRVSFFQFSTDTQSLALQCHHDSAAGQIRFEWTSSDGHRSVSQFEGI
ncbi:DUF2777 family protein [Bacillus pumilus]|uniref:DUF2777 family protein n=1 Tax=Bacillus pumilus TaxID=1408 RepID=UPI000D029AEA|nr:DUF2777 family protein [Bacillus pumilus]MBU8609100.1 DUF2777 domain-containing protein [Bacillus pumilus]MCW4682752.1 DUF2777 domain-containing protein [Bacillus pumilus]MCY7571335.1 DUF2777 domain-containing protein [Bacillus pumilus]MCY7574644.1 DUF2777 domain-containing protein [Bacillus pumilus]MEC3760497.1 DUF2777 family protein [Bacillus pumilus]